MNSKIFRIRKKLDLIDNNMLKIISKRAKLVDQILKLKKNKSEIIDKKRINIILKKIKIKSIKLKIDPKITNQIWKSMIKSFIEFEFKNFKKK